jgi:CheY-like chemotaxis protein
MSDDLVLLRMLIVSGARLERDVIRRAALEASVPIEIAEEKVAREPTATCDLLAGSAFDAVFLDSRMPKAGRQAVIDAARDSNGRPLMILVGAAELKTREVLTDGLVVNGVLAKPIDTQEARAVVEHCVRARLPNRALIVDDSSTVRSVIRKVMQASRYRLEADEAGTAAGAIAQAEQQRSDIVFLDCHMPDMDGFATLDALTRAQPDSKIVMMTGTRDMRFEDRARAEGARDFLYKPFYPKDIDAVLNRLFGLMRPRWN